MYAKIKANLMLTQPDLAFSIAHLLSVSIVAT